MSDFWNNVSRYPRFFVSSVIGTALIIITPLRNLFKVPKLRIFLIFLIFGIFGLLYLILKNMVGM